MPVFIRVFSSLLTNCFCIVEIPEDRESHYDKFFRTPKFPLLDKILSRIFKESLEETFYSDVLATKSGRKQNEILARGLAHEDEQDHYNRDDSEFDLYLVFSGSLGRRLLNYFLRRERMFV